MGQPSRWLWGLVPLALLWGVANLALDGAIQRDIGRRVERSAVSAAGQAPGARAIVAQVVGRDVSVSGEALSADGATKAMAQLRAEFGVRRALGGLSQVVAQKPYSWSAQRDAKTLSLNGFVPDEETAKANVAAAVAALPGLRIEDRQNLAFGAPAGFAAMTKALLAELPRLGSGKVALDDGRFCIEGKADSPDAFLALRQRLSELAKDGFQTVDCALEPPVVTPYRWSVMRADDGAVTVTGYYPSDAVHQDLQAQLRRSFPAPVQISDQTKPALGEPSAFPLKATRAIRELARLRSGKVELNGDIYEIAGLGPDSFDACQALQLQIAQADGPDSVARATIACPPPPPPPPLQMPALPEIPPLSVAPVPPVVAQPPAPPVALHWQVEIGASGLILKGFVPDEAARAALRAAAAELGNTSSIDDQLTIEPNLAAEPDYAAATRFALQLAGSLGRGVVALDGAGISVSGAVAGAQARQALQALLAQRPLPAGLALKAESEPLLVRPYVLTIVNAQSGLSMSGYIPDEASHRELLALVAASPSREKLDDMTTIVPTAPDGFAEAARSALVNLLRLDLGSATIDEGGAFLRGLTCRELIKSEVETSAAGTRGAVMPLDAAVALRQTGCVIDPPNTCQNDLDALTKRNSVLFGQGTSVVTLDATTERVIKEAFDILKQCPASRITIEGHANSDGEIRRYDNLDLSRRRAVRVRDELIRRGIDPGQLSVAAFGVERPLVPHGTPEAKAMNRRVQFTVAK